MQWRKPMMLNGFVFAVAAIVIALAMTREINIYDEGIILSSALHMMRGEMIHRDYFSVYGPGSYAVLATMFTLFGKGFIVSRLPFVLILAGIVATSFALLRSRVRLAIAIGTSGTILVWVIAYNAYLYPLFPCLLLILIGSMILLRADAMVRWPLLVGAGACAGLNAYFRYDVGFVMLVAHVGSMAIYLWFGSDRAERLGRIVKSACLYGVGAGIVFLPGAIYFLINAPVTAFRDDIISYGLHNYARTRSLPFPRLGELRPGNFGIYFPLLAIIIALPVAFRDLRDASAAAPHRPLTLPAVVLFTLMTALLYYKGIVRVEVLHMLMAIIPATLLVAFLADRWWVGRSLALRALAVVAVVAALVPMASAARSMTIAFRKAPHQFVIGRLAEEVGILPRYADVVETCLARPDIRGAWLLPQYMLAARFLVDHTQADEPVLIGTSRHDRVFANVVALYFVADRRPATRWDIYDPGYHTRADIQQAIIGDLARNHVRWVVRDSTLDHMSEPNESSKSSGVTILDRYLAANYRPVRHFNNVAMWLRKDVEPPLDKAPPACRGSIVEPVRQQRDATRRS